MYKKQKEQTPLANEAAVAYGQVFDNQMTVINTIKRGINYKLFSYIKDRCPFSEEEWASFLGISTKSLQRYALSQTHIFKPIHSEKILEIAEVCDAGMEVFNDKDDLYAWLTKPAFAFDYEAPMHFMDSSYGTQLIYNQLKRYAHGIFA
jgi:putative toxin-antitoxin system antitoxin component (TIGR02293 family)